MSSMFFGAIPSVEIPFDSNSETAFFATSSAGCVPADAASKPIDLANPSAICERQELPTHTKSSFMMFKQPKVI